jgi:DNA-binding MarR family transcriptional regulator
VDAVADQLHSAALHLLRRLRSEDDALGISPPRLSALSVVVFAGPIGVGALAAAEGVTAPTMSRLVDGLERDRLVRRQPYPDDARGVLVVATAKGSRVLRRGRGQRIRRLAAALRGLSADELVVVARAAELIERVTRTQNEEKVSSRNRTVPSGHEPISSPRVARTRSHRRE